MTPSKFLELVKQLRDLGAVEVSASESGYTAKFASAQAPAPKPTQPDDRPPPREHVEPLKPRQAYREHVTRALRIGATSE